MVLSVVGVGRQHGFNFLLKNSCIVGEKRFTLISIKTSQVRNFTKTHHLQYLKPAPTKLSYLNVPGETPLSSKTIGQLLDDSAEKFGDSEAVALLEQNIRRTYKQLKEEADNLAEGFLAIGLNKDDRIGIWGPNSHQWYLTYFAAAKAGLILVNINPAYQAREVEYGLKKVEVKAVVIDDKFKTQDYYEILTNIVPEIRNNDPGQTKSDSLPHLSTVISMSSTSLKGAFQFDEIMNKGRLLREEHRNNSPLERMKHLVQFDDVFNIQFTSGTTGHPKGVMLSHHNLVNNSFFIGKRFEFTQNDKVCAPVPLFHCYGSVGAMLASLHKGVPLVLPSKAFNPKVNMKAVAEEKCTILYGTPTMHVDMTHVPELKQLDLSALRLVVTAGAICPEDLARSMKEIYGARVASCYGLTETSPVFFQTLPEDTDEQRIKTIGYPQEHSEVKIVDFDGNVVPLGQPGEMCTRGYMTMLGYWEDIEKTDEVLQRDNRWFHTGDTFTMLDSGHGRIVGRIKEMIIRGGENIYPREIEDFLHLHPNISEAHVFGIPDPRMGEEVCVWIRLKQDVKMTENDVRNYCKGQISHFKIPKHIFFRSDFPTTISGKIQKFRMTEQTMIDLNLTKET